MMADTGRLKRMLGQARERLRDSSESNSEEILRRRSRELAARELEPQASEVFAEVVVVRRVDLVLAVPVAEAREVRRVEVTGLPGSTGHVNGVFQIRGKVLSLVDLAPYCSEAEPLTHGDQTLVIVVGRGDRFLGLRIDEIDGPRTILTTEIDGEFRGRELPFVRHVTRDLAHVVDVETLLTAPEVLLDR